MATNEKQSVTTAEDAYVQQALREAFDWYKQADSKAQTILGFNGTFLSIVFGSIVLKGAAFSATARSAQISVLVLAAVLSLYLAGVGLCAAALWSRGILRTRGRAEIYFFGHVANYKNGAEFLRAANRVFANPTGARIGWGDEIIELARNTRHKHRLVNLAVLLSSVALLGTVIVGLIIYVS